MITMLPEVTILKDKGIHAILFKFLVFKISFTVMTINGEHFEITFGIYKMSIALRFTLWSTNEA